MPIGTAFYPRTSVLCQSLNYREWSGCYAAGTYEPHHEHEYNAIRNAAALIDISPLFKYRLSGRDATRLVDRVIPRDASRTAVGQVLYTPWCDERGKVIDDGTIARLDEQTYRWTAAEPNLRWLHQNAGGLDVVIDDVSERIAALALQGPTSAAVLQAAADIDVQALRYFRVARGRIADVPVDVSRTGYTGDLGYEIWMDADKALTVWDTLIHRGVRHGLKPVGLVALDIARVEAGLLLIDVDFIGSRKALIDSQAYTPYEMGFERLVHLDKGRFVGRRALEEEQRRGPSRKVVGIEIDWEGVEAVSLGHGLAPVVPAATSRIAVPVVVKGRQIGRATTTAWSPLLKRLIAIGTLDIAHTPIGSSVNVEITVEGVRHFVAAKVVATPFFNPPRKTRVPPAV